MQLSACGATPTTAMSTDRTIFAGEGDCAAPTPAGSTNICEGVAVAYALGILATAQVPLTRVRRLQASGSRLQRRHGRSVSVQTPRSTDFVPGKMTRARRNSEQFA